MLTKDQVKRPTKKSQMVLIIDRSEDSRQVLKTALERRGFQTMESLTARDGLKMVRMHHPELVVLDLESIPVNAPAVGVQFDLEAEPSQTPIVILGNLRKDEALPPHCSVVRKPYHYGPLIRKIEQMVASNERGCDSPLLRASH